MPLPKKIGRYEIESLLGSGAMGSVYRGFDPVIKRVVAIKTIKAEAIANHDDPEQFKKRFFNEARICGQLHHPNIVMLYDLGEEAGTPFIAMEYLQGESLQTLIKAQTKRDYDFFVHVLEQLAAALDYAHQRDIIHRDIKPQNVMVATDGTAKIMDFGIAKFSDSHMTKTGFFVGTPSYSSPEQISGEKVDYRTDIFSLGVLAHELITGRLPFAGTSISSVLYQVVNGLPSLDYVPPQLDASVLMFKRVFLKVLNKDREKRYAKARAFVADLQELLAPNLSQTLSLPTVAGIPRDSDAFQKPAGATETPTTAGSGMGPAPPPDSPDAALPTHARRSSDGSITAPTAAEITRPSSPPGSSPPDRPTSPASPPLQRKETPPPSADLATKPHARKHLLIAALVAIPIMVFAGLLGFAWLKTEKPVSPEPTPQPPAAHHSLRILSQPPGAEISIDGRVQGSTPLDLDLDFQGDRAVRISATLPDHTARTETIDADFDFSRPLTLSLEPLVADDEPEKPTPIAEEEPEPPSEEEASVAVDTPKPDPRAQEQAFWSSIQDNPTIPSFQTYLDRYPQGKYRQRAESEIQILRERHAFETAKQADDEMLLRDFLAAYPESRFAGAVRDRLRTFQLQRAFQSAVSGNDLEFVNSVLKDFDADLTPDQRTRLTERRDFLSSVREEQKAFDVARTSDDLDVLKDFLNRFKDQNPWHTEEIYAQEKRVKEAQRNFLQRNLEHHEQTDYKMTKDRDGLDLVCSFRQKPTFPIESVEIIWELDGVPQDSLDMTPDGGSYHAAIPYAQLKEGSLNYYFSIVAGGETYHLDKMWYQTRIKDARKKIVISF